MRTKKVKEDTAVKSKGTLKHRNKKRKNSNLTNWENSLHYKLARLAYENPELAIRDIFPF